MTQADDFSPHTTYLALERRMSTAGEALSRAELVRWCNSGSASGNGAAVERRLRRMLARGAGGPGFQPFWLRLLGTTVWRRGDLPEALACYRAALKKLIETPPAPDLAPPPPKMLDNTAYLAALWPALHALAGAGVQAFAHAGTLLGLTRDGRLLRFDKDMDIGVLVDAMPAADTTLRALGWQRGPNEFPFANLAGYRHPGSGAWLDVCGFAVEPGSGLWLGGFWLPGLPREWQRISEYPDPALRRVDSPAGAVWAVADADAWLTAMYGDWRTPDPDFDTLISAHNQRGFALLSQCYGFFRVVRRWMEGDPRRALALAHQLRRQLPHDALLAEVIGTLEAAAPRRADHAA